MNYISDRANLLGESATLKMARLANELKEKGQDIISLSLGEPDFHTPEFIKESAKKAIDNNFSFYTPVAGNKDLRLAVCAKFKRDNELDYSEEQIVVSTGAKQSIMNVILATVNNGDEVIIPAPYWVSYIEMIRFAGGIPVVIETNIDTDFKITPDQLKEKLTNKSKAFLFSNPCNPSGSSYSKSELSKIAEVLSSNNNTLIISDEIYEFINFKEKNSSMAQFESIKERVITVNGLSKGYAMTGWRLGYIGAPKDIAKACTKIQGQFTSGANSITQKAAVTALEANPEKLAYMKETFRERRDLFCKALKEVEGLKVNVPEGAFYVFPDVSSFYGKKYKDQVITNSNEVCEILLKDALVATTPGEAFGSPNNIRLSYATSNDLLIEAARRLKKVFNEFVS